MVWAVVVVVCALSSIGYSTTDNFNIIHGYTQSELQAFINETTFGFKVKPVVIDGEQCQCRLPDSSSSSSYSSSSSSCYSSCSSSSFSSSSCCYSSFFSCSSSSSSFSSSSYSSSFFSSSCLSSWISSSSCSSSSFMSPSSSSWSSSSINSYSSSYSSSCYISPTTTTETTPVAGFTTSAGPGGLFTGCAVFTKNPESIGGFELQGSGGGLGTNFGSPGEIAPFILGSGAMNADGSAHVKGYTYGGEVGIGTKQNPKYVCWESKKLAQAKSNIETAYFNGAKEIYLKSHPQFGNLPYLSNQDCFFSVRIFDGGHAGRSLKMEVIDGELSGSSYISVMQNNAFTSKYDNKLTGLKYSKGVEKGQERRDNISIRFVSGNTASDIGRGFLIRIYEA